MKQKDFYLRLVIALAGNSALYKDFISNNGYNNVFNMNGWAQYVFKMADKITDCKKDLFEDNVPP